MQIAPAQETLDVTETLEFPGYYQIRPELLVEIQEIVLEYIGRRSVEEWEGKYNLSFKPFIWEIKAGRTVLRAIRIEEILANPYLKSSTIATASLVATSGDKSTRYLRLEIANTTLQPAVRIVVSGAYSEVVRFKERISHEIVPARHLFSPLAMKDRPFSIFAVGTILGIGTITLLIMLFKPNPSYFPTLGSLGIPAAIGAWMSWIFYTIPNVEFLIGRGVQVASTRALLRTIGNGLVILTLATSILANWMSMRLFGG